MSSDFKNNFCFVTEEIFELEVSESALKLKHMEKNLGTIRGRQATVDALIGNERYPTIRRLRTHSDWLRKVSQRTLIGYENYQDLSEDWVHTNGNRKGLKILGAFHYAKLTGQRSVGIPEENGTTFSD